VWLEFIQFEEDNGEKARVEQILGMALRAILDVEMWRAYLNLVRRNNSLIIDPDGSHRALIQQVFDVVLDKVGIDPDAGQLWREYIEFIKSYPGSVSGTGWQDLQKVDILRKAYQRAIALPHQELMPLWKEYDSFELGLNRAAGRKNLNEQGAAYMTAKGAKTQLDNKLAGLDRAALPKLPPVYGCAGDDEFGDQVERWRAWVDWEKADELVLKNEEGGVQYRKRVLYALKQATMALHFYPEIWYEAASWCFEQELPDMVEEGDQFLNDGIKANPESVLLALKKADRVEAALPSNTSDEIAIENGNKIDMVFEDIHKALYRLRDKYNEREKFAQAQIQDHFARMTPEADAEKQDGEDEEMEDEDKPKSRKEQMEEQLKAVKANFDGQREVLKRTISYVWSAKMRAFRRIQGQGAPKQAKKGFRGVFAEARPRGMLTSDVYIASALLEHHCYRDAAATRIFDRGLKLFPIDELFALEYLKHLISINDLTNAKAVFETTLTKIQNTNALPEEVRKDKCRPLLGFMHSFESNYGDLAQIHKLEKRMAEMFPSEPDLLRFSNRFESPTFNALKTQLPISATQIQTKSVNPAYATQPPPFSSMNTSADIRLGPHGPYVASPKRPLDDSDADTPQRKRFMRADSPSKRHAMSNMSATVPVSNTTIPIQQQGGNGGFVTKNYVPGAAAPERAPTMPAMQAPSLPREITYLLSILPNARDYQATRFDGAKLVQLLQGVEFGGRR
jgi:cleavage stimulation factor subunit 3